MTFVAYGSDEILFAEFESQLDAHQTQIIIQKLLKKKYPTHRVYVRSESGRYLVLSDPIPNADEKRRIVKYIREAFGVEGEEDATSSNKTFSSTIRTSMGYNNNIYDHTRIKTTTYNNFVIDNNTSIIKDIFMTNSAIFSQRYSAKNPSLSWNSSISFYDKHYRYHSDINLRQLTIESGFDYAVNNRYFSLPFYFKRLWYGGSAYRHSFGISPKFIYKPNKETSLSLELDLFQKRYLQTIKKDWNVNQLNMGLGFNLLSRSHATINGTIGLNAERRIQGARSDLSYNSLYVSGRFLMPLWRKAYADLGFRFDRRAYLHKHPNLALREDTRFKLDVGLIQPVTDSLSAKISYSHVDNISTINAYTHKSDTITVSLSAFF